MPFDLADGRRIYGFWGRHPRLYWAGDWPIFFGRRAEIRRRAVDALGLKGGEAVLELACGPGVNFQLLERAIGTSGKLTALDYSQEMLAAARERARREGWQNVELVQADAARTQLPAESFDAALCILGLSVIPDHQAAIARVLAALKGGGRFVVLDGRPGPLGGRGRMLNPALKPLFRYVYNADVEKDLVPDLERAFDEVAVDEFNGGSLFIAAARKAAGPAGAGSA
jgi:phosphatidylethanolamine/phosphatidyl-N-methylethanolamine N-methyltransferase